MDASNASTFTFNGGTISQWGDKATGDGAQNLTQGNAANQPASVINGIGGLPTVRFDGNDALTNATNFSTPYTIFSVSRLEGTQNQRLITAVGNNWLLGYHSPGLNQMYAEGWVANQNLAANTATHFYAANGSGELTNFYDGDTLIASNAGGIQGPNGIDLGGAFGGQFSKGDVSELLIYNSVLSAGDFAAVMDYLQARYVAPINGIPDGSQVNIAAGATLDLNGINETIGNLAGAATGTVPFERRQLDR